MTELSKQDWKAGPEHPDATAQGEAQRLFQALTQAHQLPEISLRPMDFQSYLEQSLAQSSELLGFLSAPSGLAPAQSVQAQALIGSLAKNCEACHAGYRN